MCSLRTVSLSPKVARECNSNPLALSHGESSNLNEPLLAPSGKNYTPLSPLDSHKGSEGVTLVIYICTKLSRKGKI